MTCPQDLSREQANRADGLFQFGSSQSCNPWIGSVQRTAVAEQTKDFDQEMQIYECIGVLQASFRDETGRLISINYSTAFLVSQIFILTCAHNIHSEKLGRSANQLKFMHKSKAETYIFQGQDFKFLPLKEGKSLLNYPTINEACLIVLNRPVSYRNCIKLCCDIPLKNDLVQIVGYPRKKYANSACISTINARRLVLDGRATSDQGIIRYKMKTRTGLSGSPILYKSTEGLVAVGMHAHPGEDGFNQGLYFNQQTLGLIRSYERDFQRKYGLEASIQYYNLQENFYYSQCGSSQLEDNLEIYDSQVGLDGSQTDFESFYDKTQAAYDHFKARIGHKSDEKDAVMVLNRSNVSIFMQKLQEKIDKDSDYLTSEGQQLGAQ